MAERLVAESPELVEACGGLTPDVVETAGLAHDLGHPPFGHDGEEVIDKAMAEHPDCDGEGFEGNAQSLRIVTSLAVRDMREEARGLNLTRASVNGILKYPRLWQPAGDRKQKWGVYKSDRSYFDWARQGIPRHVPSVEAALMDWADDITYAVHDMEDFYRAGLIPLERLAPGYGSGREVEHFIQAARESRPRLRHREDLHSMLSSVLGPLPLLEAPFDGGRRHRAVLRRATSALIARFVSAISLREPDDEGDGPVEIDDPARTQVDLLMALTRYYVIEHPRVVGVRAGQRGMLKQLFGVYCEAIEQGTSRDLAMLPQATRDRLDSGDSTQRLAADLLASMTERQVVQTYQRLMGLATSPVSYFDI